MYKKSFSLENKTENAPLASVHFIRFENVINNFITIFGNQLWTVALMLHIHHISVQHLMTWMKMLSKISASTLSIKKRWKKCIHSWFYHSNILYPIFKYCILVFKIATVISFFFKFVHVTSTNLVTDFKGYRNHFQYNLYCNIETRVKRGNSLSFPFTCLVCKLFRRTDDEKRRAIKII